MDLHSDRGLVLKVRTQMGHLYDQLCRYPTYNILCIPEVLFYVPIIKFDWPSIYDTHIDWQTFNLRNISCTPGVLLFISPVLYIPRITVIVHTQLILDPTINIEMYKNDMYPWVYAIYFFSFRYMNTIDSSPSPCNGEWVKRRNGVQQFGEYLCVYCTVSDWIRFFINERTICASPSTMCPLLRSTKKVGEKFIKKSGCELNDLKSGWKQIIKSHDHANGLKNTQMQCPQLK